jgi:hypothetical protein
VDAVDVGLSVPNSSLDSLTLDLCRDLVASASAVRACKMDVSVVELMFGLVRWFVDMERLLLDGWSASDAELCDRRRERRRGGGGVSVVC